MGLERLLKLNLEEIADEYRADVVVVRTPMATAAKYSKNSRLKSDNPALFQLFNVNPLNTAQDYIIEAFDQIPGGMPSDERVILVVSNGHEVPKGYLTPEILLKFYQTYLASSPILQNLADEYNRDIQ